MTEDEARLKLLEQDKLDALSRRDFLKLLGASFAALSAAGCKLRPPQEKIIPFVEQPEDMVPGLARWYATTCGGCPAACGVLAKSRDGRPIKLEGNPEHPLSRGGLCARGQATVLDLYDSERVMQPMVRGTSASWAALDEAVLQGLETARRHGKSIRLLSQTVPSPSLSAAAAGFLKRWPGARHVVYDSLSVAAIREAHRRTHGAALLPHYHFDRARAIVAFGADFLGTWISPVEFAKQWSANRQPDGGDWDLMSWHAQYEARLSLTGANADLRVPLRPSQELPAVLALAALVAERVGWNGSLPPRATEDLPEGARLAQTADMLVSAARRGLVVSSSSDADVQTAVNWLNEMLGNYGASVDLDRPSRQGQGEAGALAALQTELERGDVGALIVLGANPAYDHPEAEAFAKAMSKAGLIVALAERMDETAVLAGCVAPVPHALESWGDAEPVKGVHSLIQPLLSPLFDARPALESLLRWSGKKQSAYEFVRARWRREVFPRQKEHHGFGTFWENAVRRGVVETEEKAGTAAKFDPGSVARLRRSREPLAGDFELAAYPSVALADGRQANNPWLQELPDPVSRVAWGNYASFSPADAARLGVSEGRMVRLSAPQEGGRSVELPAHVQPGLADGVVAAALGYGRLGAGKIAANYPMVKMLPIEKDLLAGADLYPLSAFPFVRIVVLDRTSELAKVQTYDSQTDPLLDLKRPVLRETTMQDYFKNPKGETPSEEEASLWPRHEYKGHKWGMTIDLNSCTGCSACVVACQAENNVPVVGKAEMRKGRDMAWIRIDRYYGEEKAPESPSTGFQPMLCQHCDNAPCETVCPVLATVHSSEGLNMQVYNRCVGTRYCANNCPYKVRRFNWFDYAHQDLLQNMALNPDVTVRSRGVMEKCTFCVQRIGGAKALAKADGKGLKDGDVTPACAQSCPGDAIVFGDLNDPESRVARIAKRNRSYRVLEELGVGPSVFYQTKVRNKKV